MVKIGIAILLIGLVYSYGVQAQDTNTAQVESVDVTENKDDSGVITAVNTGDGGDDESDPEVDGSKNENSGGMQPGWMHRMPPPPRHMRPMFQNFPGFRMPHMPRMPSLDDIKNMTPGDENTQVFGSGASFSSSQKVVNGELVEDKQYGKIVTNNNGEIEEKVLGTDE